MNILICDDDKRDMERLKSLITAYDAERNIGAKLFCYEDGESLLKAIKETAPDMIFLDINMDGTDGLELARKVREKLEEVPIILVTAFINYAIDDYKVGASRFLIKDGLDKTINECMDDICGQIRKKTKRLLFSCVEGDVTILLSEISYIETSGHKSIIHTKIRDYHLYEGMERLEGRLKFYGFSRVHRSYLVNIRHIRSIKNYILTLDTGEEIIVPKARYRQVRQERALFLGKTL